MATQFLLKLDFKMQYKYENIKIFKKIFIYSMQKESRKKILATVSSCVAMYKSTWRALSFGTEFLDKIHVASRPQTAQLRNRGSIPDKTKTSLLQYFQTILRSIQTAFQQIQGYLSFGIKRPVPEADFSTPFSRVMVKNDWRSTSSLLFAFKKCTETNALYHLVTHTNTCIHIYNLRSLKFTLKHLKCSYVFRSHDHPQ